MNVSRLRPLRTPGQGPRGQGVPRKGMTLVPGGSFRMGSAAFYPEEDPVITVEVQSLWVGNHPVTNAAFRRFVAGTGHVTVAESAPDPSDFPGADPALLVPGSQVFTPTAGPAPLDDWTTGRGDGAGCPASAGATPRAPAPPCTARTCTRWCTSGWRTPSPTPPDASHVRRSFRRVVKAAGLDPAEWAPLELRHSFVSLLSDTDVPIEHISRLVGHSSTKTTETIYRKQIRPVIIQGADVMDRIFPQEPGDA